MQRLGTYRGKVFSAEVLKLLYDGDMQDVFVIRLPLGQLEPHERQMFEEYITADITKRCNPQHEDEVPSQLGKFRRLLDEMKINYRVVTNRERRFMTEGSTYIEFMKDNCIIRFAFMNGEFEYTNSYPVEHEV